MSSLDTNALLKASALGAVVTVLLTVVGYAINFAMGITPGAIPDATDFSGSLFLVSACLGCVGYLVYLGYGALYGFFARQNETPVEVGPYALGGAATGLIVGLVSVVLGVIGILINAPAMASAFSGIDPETAGVVAAAGLAGGLVGLCIGLVIFVALAAGGGAIYAAIAGSSQRSAA